MATSAVMADDVQGLAASFSQRAAAASVPGSEPGTTLLHLAAAHGSIGCVQFLSARVPLNSKSRSGCTPLLLCCTHVHPHHCEAARILIKAGASLDAKRKGDRRCALHLSAAAGCPSCVSAILARAPHLIDSRDKEYREPLHDACASSAPGACACAALLIREGAQLESSTLPAKLRPLHLACSQGLLESALLLLDRGVSINARSAARRTPLHEAAAAFRQVSNPASSHVSHTQFPPCITPRAFYFPPPPCIAASS